MEPTVAEEGTGKGTGTGGTDIGLRTTAAVAAAADSGGIGGGDPTWAASVVVSCNAEPADTRPCGSTVYFSRLLFFFLLLGDGQGGFALCRSHRRV